MNATEMIIETKLSSWDPFSLVIFPNQKEYDIEAKLIARKITETKNHGELMAIIQKVLKKSFGLSIDMEKCQFVAKSIWNEFNDVVSS